MRLICFASGPSLFATRMAPFTSPAMVPAPVWQVIWRSIGPKNAGVRALAYNDVAFLTAIGNDLNYDQVFARPLDWYGRAGDLLATISASGNSANVLRAIEVARRKGCRVLTFSGMKPDNLSRRLGDFNFYVPALTYGIAECSHQVLLHAWLDRFMNVHEWQAKTPQRPPPSSRTLVHEYSDL